jgi:predicted TPR repeat methyltransferase
MTEDYLSRVYTARTAEERRAIYDAWAKTYEADLARGGYPTPARCAAALRQLLPDPEAPILDVGCGTGLSGLALRAEGFTMIDGIDPSPAMLEEARAKGLYRHLSAITEDEAYPQGYRALTAMGVIGAGAAPLAVLDRMIAALPPGGLAVFSFNEHTLEDPAYLARVAALTEAGTVRERVRELGEHLPEKNMKSLVLALEKT